MNIPVEILNDLKSIIPNELNEFELAHQRLPQRSLRFNNFKIKAENADIDLSRKVPWAQGAYYVSSDFKAVLDPQWHAGCFYMQEASSMFLEQILEQLHVSEKQQLILDLCASPGGKATHISALMHPDSVLIANEVIAKRVNGLRENLLKWGKANTWISNSDAVHFRKCGSIVDILLVDAPCSGSGLFRKDKAALEHWNEHQVQHCGLRQERILEDILPVLKSNAYLIYSTCSFSTRENEEILDYLIENQGLLTVDITIDPSWGVVRTISEKHKGIGYRFLPHRLKGEGFFIAVLQKARKEALIDKPKERKKGVEKVMPTLPNYIRTEGYHIQERGDELFAFRNTQFQCYRSLKQNVKMVHAGIHLGKFVHKKFIPSHDVALSEILNLELVPKIEVGKEDALKYLSKLDFELSSAPLGYVLIMYKKTPLGWVNNLKGRFNNYYPSNYRIMAKNILKDI